MRCKRRITHRRHADSPREKTVVHTDFPFRFAPPQVRRPPFRTHVEAGAFRPPFRFLLPTPLPPRKTKMRAGSFRRRPPGSTDASFPSGRPFHPARRNTRATACRAPLPVAQKIDGPLDGTATYRAEAVAAAHAACVGRTVDSLRGISPALVNTQPQRLAGIHRRRNRHVGRQHIGPFAAEIDSVVMLGSHGSNRRS